MKKISAVIFVLFFALTTFAQTQPKSSSRILFVPLDDRPPCLQFTQKMGLVGDAEVVAPPKEMLGKFTEFGDSDQIVEWLGKQDVKSFDAAIISLDMLAYGGLVAMREHGATTQAVAEKRIAAIRTLKMRNPKLPVYVQSVIMRLAPTGTGANENYRENLSRWADFAHEPDEKSKAEIARLEKLIPAAALADYKAARARDLTINLQAVEMVRGGAIDYLILSQDDAKPKGIHIADREKLIAEIKNLNLTDQIAVQPGADEVSMLLLARALNRQFNYWPKIKSVYSSEKLSNTAMPFEDRALRETVSFHIKATGSQEVQNEREADILFYVYPSRFEVGRAASFASEIAEKLGQNKPVIVADVDPKGDVQGGDAKFTTELENRAPFLKLSGYAAWNTAGNTIGTALPHGAVFEMAKARIANGENPIDKARGNQKVSGYSAKSERIGRAQQWFLLHRWLDDYVYHTIVRQDAKQFIQQNKFNPFRMTDSETTKVEAFSAPKVAAYFADSRNHLGKNARDANAIGCNPVASSFKFDLPWNRTFEADIDFELQCANPVIVKP